MLFHSGSLPDNQQPFLNRGRRLRRSNPTSYILDLAMPVLDGLTASRDIAKVLPDIPILMHTLHWSAQVELEARMAGVRKVVPKSDLPGVTNYSVRPCLCARF